MRLAEMTVIKMQYKLELIIVKSAELAEAFFNLLHHVHVLGCLSVDCRITFISRSERSISRAFVRSEAGLRCLLVRVIQVSEASP